MITLSTGLGFHPVSSACGKMWGRRLSLSLAAWQDCAYVLPQSSKGWCHTPVLSPCCPDQSWTLQWCQWGPVSCGEPCDAVGACRGSGHGSHALLVDATPAKMSHVAYRCSCGQVKGKQKFGDLDGNFTTCNKQLISVSKSHRMLQFQCCHQCLRALGYFTCGCFMGISSSPRHSNDFLQPAGTQRGCDLHIALCFSRLDGIQECGSHSGGFPANLHSGCSLGSHPAYGNLVSQGEQHKPFYPFLWLIQSFPFGARDREEEAACAYGPRMRITLAQNFLTHPPSCIFKPLHFQVSASKKVVWWAAGVLCKGICRPEVLTINFLLSTITIIAFLSHF